MLKLWDIWHFYPSVSVLASFFSLSSCLIDILITGLCLYAGDACLLWMNFNTVFYGSCWIYYASLSSFVYDSVITLLMIVFHVLPQSSQPRNIPETLKLCLLYWVLFEIVLACFFSLGNNFWHKQYRSTISIWGFPITFHFQR